ncbi:unnamed protein product [Choristocarpus tenellus]
MFGGCGRGEFDLNTTGDDVVLDDLYEYDINTLQWSRIPRTFERGELWPEGRRSAAMAIYDDKLYLSGGAGQNPDALRGNLLEFDLRTRLWRKRLADEEGLPFKLCGQTVCVDERKGRLLYFGGSTGLEYRDDTLEYLPATNQCHKVATSGRVPSPRYKHQAFILGGSMYIVGGGSFRPQGMHIDMFLLDLESHRWESVVTTGDIPQARVAHSCGVDEETGNIYVFGGFTAELRCARWITTYTALCDWFDP